MTRSTWFAGALAAFTLFAACGVPAESRLQPIDPSEIPIAIGTTPSSSDPVVPTIDVPAPQGIYLVDADGRVVRRPRSTITDVPAALDLLASPTPSQQPGLRSALPAGTVVALHTSNDSGGPVLTIDLAASFLDLPVDEQRLALAQIVLTVTDRAGDLGVSFAINGSVVNVPRSDASVSDGPVGRADYVDLLTA